MKVNVTTDTGVIIATISGRFDAHGIETFDRSVLSLIDDANPHVVIDLEKVEFMDSSALAGLVRALKATIEHSGSITLAGVSDAARIILELTRLDSVFATAETAADARAQVLAAA